MSFHTAFAIVDAFTTQRAFSGNPAGVMLLDAFPGDEWMQGVANELHQAETAFLVADGESTFRLRWFTPTTEVALCGHATLASAHWLWEAGVLPEDAVAVFTTRSGRLTAERDGGRVVLDFPAARPVEEPASPDLLAALDGTVPVWTGVTSHPDPAERNVMAVLDSAEAVRSLTPDLQAVARLPAGGLIVTAAGGDAAVVSRYFAPAYGIPEDPVTGSAHCTIGPYWRDALGATLAAEQASPRGGELTVVTTDAGRVRLSGTARTAVTGFVH
ncbi:PhzF family phenazine biosynthesis protein [Nocardioides sp.]|uniref:PhzF family phenazine biosynthesis protein n=1 Tax=Nocardioides sp. TaxID=35761 RepID=UPI002D1B2C6E|nr:PhzF family phenazine biosynthesis protein [Nocardioides sp.]HXH80138.1 PhzF family phenazine biosynthesis protein [Nocardioides sp.]